MFPSLLIFLISFLFGQDDISDAIEMDLTGASPMVTSSRIISQASNVYTPLNQNSTSRSNPSMTAANSPEKRSNISASFPQSGNHLLKRHMDQPKSTTRSPNSRTQRSSVRPFFCCGSEQSLISLIDSIELKEPVMQNRKSKTGELKCSPDGEEVNLSLLGPVQKTSSSSVGIGGKSHSRRKKKDKHVGKKKSWSLRFRGRWHPRGRVPQPQRSSSLRESSHQSMVPGSSGSYAVAGQTLNRHSPRSRRVSSTASSSPVFELTHVPDLNRLYPTEDIDTVRVRNRAEEMAFGIEVDPNVLNRAFRPNLGVSGSMIDVLRRRNRLSSTNSDILQIPDSPIEDYSDFLMNSFMLQWQGARGASTTEGNIYRNMPQIHTQIDFIHCLVPELSKITACSFYWGVMDRYEAERLLDNKPEGTFLLRDSAQEEFLFSVSFRRYNRSLHARVEQWNHRFSFDAHDPAVFSAPSVCELMEHYKDSSLCMFFEPMLTRPLHRNFPFSLQHLTRAVICDQIAYDHIRVLPLPNSLKQFLQMYHYKQKVRVRHFDGAESEVSYCDPVVVR